MIWEYFVLPLAPKPNTLDRGGLQTVLDAAGIDRWELVTIMPERYAIFKRPMVYRETSEIEYKDVNTPSTG